jgi:glycosyltransferase involved in cell wall biosynthesis
MRKILIITDNLKDQINGVVTTFKNIEAYASADDYSIVYLDPGQFNYISCPGYSEVKLSFPYKIGKKIKALNPDYIHIATEGPLGFAARCWLDSKGWKYNTSYHTKFPDFLKQIYGIPESITYRYVRWFHKHSGKVLTTTQTMVKDLKANGFLGDIVSWTRGVDRNIFKPSLRLVNDKTVLLSVGRVSKEKGLDDFCALEYPNSVKVVVGDGPYRKELEKKYPNVKFVGVKRGKALAEYYADADAFIFTSRTDTFGIVIIESLACGTPVAAYPVPGPIDILENGVTGFMSKNLVDAIDRSLQLNREQVEVASRKWSWQNCWNIFRDNLIDKN